MQGTESLAQLADGLHPVLERPGQAPANQRGEAFGQWVGPDPRRCLAIPVAGD